MRVQYLICVFVTADFLFVFLFVFCSDKNHADQYGFTRIFKHLGGFIHCYVMPDLDPMYVKSFFC